jgi:phosphate transport system protein
VVPDAVVQATAALLASDAEVAANVARWRVLLESIYSDIAVTVESHMALQAPVATDLRFLLGCVRLLPVLQAGVDEIADIASPVSDRLGTRVTPRMRSLLWEMGEATASTWRAVETEWRDRHAPAVDVVRDRDDALADTRSTLTAEIASGVVDVPVAIEVALVARSFDRLGHHAATASRLIAPLVTTPRT